jgi:tetratricopeptide (TPR) repeat protein
MVSMVFLVIHLSRMLIQSNLGQVPAKAPTSDAPTLSAEQRGDILMARKMYREAVDVYREGPADSALLHNKTGIAFHQLLQFNLAKKEYEQAIKLNPQYAEAINNLGAIYYAQKNYRRAVRQYTKALAITPEAASIYSNLGSAYFARKDYPKAAECYQKALAIDPEVFEHHNQYGTLLQERSTTERAKFHYYLAKTYAKAGQNERALQYIRKALEEGFTDRKKFMEESEFTNLRALPEFKELMALEPRVL